MKLAIIEVQKRDKDLTEALTSLWERSVRATHDFLTEEAITGIRAYVPSAIAAVPHLFVAYEDNIPAAFIGIGEDKIEMLFVDPDKRGRGTGRMLLEHAVSVYPADKVSVNEQNPQAIGFYEHLGFRTYKRTEKDEEGNPYPLLYMKRHRSEHI